jgi:hypothetical protein
MSELSTVAIKDGHRGHFPHQRNPAEAERNDRISRLAGLERVGVAGRTPQGLAPGSANNPPPGYFDANNQPQLFRERSTVGSASATGSVGGRTTWASGSDAYEADRMSMSEDQDVETSSIGGFSDEAASLVGFGEGARTPARQHSHIGSPAVGKASAVPGYLREQAPANPMAGVSVASSAGTTTSSSEQQQQDARTMNGSPCHVPLYASTDLSGPGRSSTTEQAVQQHMRQRQADQDVVDFEQQKGT